MRNDISQVAQRPIWQELSDRGVLTARDIAVEDLPSFESFKLINAMLRFDFPELPVSAIVE